MISIFKKNTPQSNPVENKNLNFPEVNNWTVSQFIVNKIIPIVDIHPFPLSELQLMVSALCWSNPKVVFDWGTHMGKSARVFYETKKYFNLNTKIISIDLPSQSDHNEHPGEKRGVFVKSIKEVGLELGDGVDTAIKISKKMKLESALFFLDGDHSHSTVKRELNTINKNIKNPHILIHDTFFQSKESKYNVGPHKAVAEFIKKNKSYRKIEASFGLPGMTFLYKK